MMAEKEGKWRAEGNVSRLSTAGLNLLRITSFNQITADCGVIRGNGAEVPFPFHRPDRLHSPVDGTAGAISLRH